VIARACTKETAKALEELYEKYNRREFVHPDPLEFLFDYDEAADREIVALVASSLAYGRVAQILKSISRVLERMPSPREFLEKASHAALKKTFKGFKHRFTTGGEIAALLYGAGKAIGAYGSLHECFTAAVGSDSKNIFSALSVFTKELISPAGCGYNSLLPRPDAGSACKRLNLFLRWMVRRDGVDPGGWDRVSPSMLVVPLDTHMHRIGRALGLTKRKQAGMKTAIEITEALGKINPDDPVKYDFALTRLGIRDDTDRNRFLAQCGIAEAR